MLSNASHLQRLNAKSPSIYYTNILLLLIYVWYIIFNVKQERNDFECDSSSVIKYDPVICKTECVYDILFT